MCDYPNREAAMVTIRTDENGKPTVWCDPCLSQLVTALNDGGMPTRASCCGHGTHVGSVALADGRWIVVMTAEDWTAFDSRSGTATDAEVQTHWEYGVRHIAVDGWPTDLPHASIEEARTDLDTCGMNCYLIRRASAREAGDWEPYVEGARVSAENADVTERSAT